MDSSIVTGIICGIFDNCVRKSQNSGEPAERKALMVRFRVGEDERPMEMLIYAPGNYVGVYLMDGYSDDSQFSDFGLKSYHDSCWRQDGVNRIIFENRESFWFEQVYSPNREYKTIAPGIYVINLSEEAAQELSLVEQKVRAGSC